MRNLILLSIFLVSAIIYSCNGKKTSQADTPTTELKVDLQTYNIAIEGMTCTGCEQTIQNSVLAIEGVDSISASHLAKSAIVSFDPQKTDTSAIKEAITKSGYEVLGFSENNE
jgi:copper chaperone CopZ